MAVRTTVDIPEDLHEKLRARAEQSGVSIPSVIVDAIDAYTKPNGGKFVTGPMIKGGKRGPAYPTDENPHDLVFS